MKKLALLICLLLLSGCAAPVFKVKLMLPETTAPVVDMTVQDSRLDTQIYMTGISLGSSLNLYLLEPEPSLDVMLMRFIQSKAPRSISGLGLFIKIERLDLKNKVGFAKADELYCELESSVVRRGHNLPFLVKTYAKNLENMSPLVVTSASIILRQCLEKHAQEIVQQLVYNGNGG